ncbi:MAG: hypothetical protein JXA20_01465 [Spirochaetes bacterium]|nr:hypothetical protein [Spirochaetota bacterium]
MKAVEPIKLVSVTGDRDATRVVFASYLKPDFVERAMTVRIGADRIVREIEFSSNEYGTALWVNGRGITDCHRWEDEETVQSTSYLNRHYPALLLNGPMSEDYAERQVIPDVLDSLESVPLRETIRAMVGESRSETAIDPSLLELS